MEAWRRTQLAGVRQLLVGKQFTFQDQGEHALESFDDPVKVWQLEI